MNGRERAQETLASARFVEGVTRSHDSSRPLCLTTPDSLLHPERTKMTCSVNLHWPCPASNRELVHGQDTGMPVEHE